MTSSADNVPVPKVPGDNAPEGSNVNEVHIYKAYFCKYMCQSEHDNFYEDQIFNNDEFKTQARAIYNEETQKDFLDKIFDSDAEYQKMTRFVISSLENQGLLTREVESDGSTYAYRKTSKLRELCPKILGVDLPSIDFLVDEYDKEHH